MDVFISWSGDCAKQVAGTLHKWLKIFFPGVEVWSSDRDIAAGAVWLSELFKQLKKSQFGVLCVTPENVTAPWLIFEAGAICRGLESARVVPYCFQIDPLELAEPLNHIQGVRTDNDGTYRLVKSLNEAYDRPRSEKQLDEAFKVLWPALEKDLAAIEAKQDELDQAARGFCDRISGFWWERIHPDDSSAISFVHIEPEPATNTIRMVGRAFGLDSSLVAHWETVATCINEGEKKVFYYWKGWHPEKPTDPYEGFGEIIFRETPKTINSGHGVFSDVNLADLESITKKSFVLRRCTNQEQQVMEGGDRDQISALVGKKILEMK